MNFDTVLQDKAHYRNNNIIKYSSIILILLLLPGCFNSKQPVQQVNFYLLEYEEPDNNKFSQLPFTVKIEPFTVSPLYDFDQIVYKEFDFTRSTYFYHKWRIKPGSLIRHFITRDLKASSIFKGVFDFNSKVKASHILEGSVDEIFEIDKEKNWLASIAITITLIKNRSVDIDREIIFQKQYKALEPCDTKNPRALAKAMSNAMRSLSDRIIMDIYNSLNNSN